MGQVLRAGVIGAGVFGGYHAQKYAALPGVTLVGVYDHHAVHAEALAARLRRPGVRHRGRADRRGRHRLDRHARHRPRRAGPRGAGGGQGGLCGKAGRHRPARTPPASPSWRRGGRGGRLRLPGARRRCRPWASSTFPSGRCCSRRCGSAPPSPRNLDVSVVLDLMIHDLDLALALSRRRARDGRGRRRARGQRHARPGRRRGRVRRRLRRPLPRLARRREPGADHAHRLSVRRGAGRLPDPRLRRTPRRSRSTPTSRRRRRARTGWAPASRPSSPPCAASAPGRSPPSATAPVRWTWRSRWSRLWPAGPRLNRSENPPMSNAYDFSFTSIDGEPLPLSSFKGKPVLVVNVASTLRADAAVRGHGGALSRLPRPGPHRARRALQPVRRPGAGDRGRDQGLLPDQVRRRLPDDLQGRREGRRRATRSTPGPRTSWARPRCRCGTSTRS